MPSHKWIGSQAGEYTKYPSQYTGPPKQPQPKLPNLSQYPESPLSPISVDPETGEVEASLVERQLPIRPEAPRPPIPPVESTPKVWRCGGDKNCKLTFPSEVLATAHCLTAHRKEGILTCTLPSCPTKPTFIHIREFDRHLAKYHQSHVDIVCNSCAREGKVKRFRKYENFQTHKNERHMKDRTFPCPRCEQVWGTRKKKLKCLSECRKLETKARKKAGLLP
jgi:hypothetical protein